MASVKKKQIYCPNCEMNVLGEKNGVSHVLHIFLTILTFGLWAFVYGLVLTHNLGSEFMCPHCGTGVRV